MIDRRKQYKYVINMPSIEDKFQIKSAIFEPVIFKTAHKKCYVELHPMETP